MIETERANLIADLYVQLAQRADAAIIVPPVRYVKHGGYMVCGFCGLAAPYCKGGHVTTPDMPSADAAAESSLDRRIAEVKTRPLA